MPEPKAARLPWALYLGGALAVAIAFTFALLFAGHHRSALAQEAAERRQLVAAGPRVLVVQVGKTPLARDVQLPGDVIAYQQTTLYAKVSGYLREIRVDKGDLVKRNQILGHIESPETDQLVAAARATYETNQRVAARNRELLARKLVAQQDVDVTDAAERTAKAALEQNQALQAYEVLRAPFDGRVTARYADPGALLQAATSTAGGALPLVDLQEEDKVRVRVYLGQDDAAFVRDHDAAEVVSDDRPDRVIKASVTRVSGALDPRTRTMLSEIDLDNRAAILLPGTFVHVTIHFQAHPQPVVPAEALIARGDQLFVAVVADNHAHLVAIEPGADDGKQVQIRSGLKGGEWIALNVSTGLQDGDPVQPVSQSGEAH